MPEPTDLEAAYNARPTNAAQSKPANADYYTVNPDRKVGDFCLGFFGMIVSSILLFMLGASSFFFGYLSYLLMFAVLILGITLPFTNGRRYIGIGVISSIIIPLLLFGACLLIFSRALSGI